MEKDFTFSQNALQDFIDCPRRFQLRHLLRLEWPAAETDDQLAQERRTRLGHDFHLLLQQHFSGIPAESVIASICDEQLAGWWRNFSTLAKTFPWMATGVSMEGISLFPEFQLSAMLGNFKVTAKYDLIAVNPGRHFWIYDWKTSSVSQKAEKLEFHPQTLLYRWLLVKAGAPLNGGLAILPEQVSMTYWFAQDAQQLVFPYSQTIYSQDQSSLLETMSYISSLADADFRLTENLRACRFCVYRSYCETGYAPGAFSDSLAEGEGDSLPDWDDLPAGNAGNEW